VFDRTARYYDKIYAFKDYAAEVQALMRLIDRGAGGRLLDVACGTGAHLELLRAHFEVEGLDLSSGLLDIARGRLPGVPLHCADMRTFELPTRFDVINCLFSAIGYMTTLEDLRRAVGRMSAHLKGGGLLAVEPWFTPDAWRPNTPHMTLVDELDLRIARLNKSLADGRVSIVDFHYVIATPQETTHVVEHHRLGLFTGEEMIAAFEEVGLSVRYDSVGIFGRGLYLARKEACP